MIDRSLPSDRQRFVLERIDESLRVRGFPPTIRELMEALDGASTNGPNDHLRALIRKGYLLRDEQQARGLRLTKKALELLGREPGRCPHCGGELDVQPTTGRHDG